MEVIPNILNRKVYDIAAKSSNTAAPQPRQAPPLCLAMAVGIFVIGFIH